MLSCRINLFQFSGDFLVLGAAKNHLYRSVKLSRMGSVKLSHLVEAL